MQIHLFDIDIPGGVTFKESDTLSPGTTATVVDTDVGRLGIGICYDIRFPELAIMYAQRGVQLIVFPGGDDPATLQCVPEQLPRYPVILPLYDEASLCPCLWST